MNGEEPVAPLLEHLYLRGVWVGADEIEEFTASRKDRCLVILVDCLMPVSIDKLNSAKLLDEDVRVPSS